MSAENIELEFDWTPPEIPRFFVSWPSYGINEETVRVDAPICPSTCRPYYNVYPTETWFEKAERVYHMKQEELISANACYISFVQRYDRYPETYEEFLTYLYYYYVVHRNKMSLPAPIWQFVGEVLDGYKDIIKTVSVEEFKKRTIESLMINRRVEMEKI